MRRTLWGVLWALRLRWQARRRRSLVARLLEAREEIRRHVPRMEAVVERLRADGHPEEGVIAALLRQMETLRAMDARLTESLRDAVTR